MWTIFDYCVLYLFVSLSDLAVVRSPSICQARHSHPPRCDTSSGEVVKTESSHGRVKLWEYGHGSMSMGAWAWDHGRGGKAAG